MSTAISSQAKDPPPDMGGMPVDLDKIRKLRITMGLTQAQCAERAGIGDRQAWNRLEHGRRKIATIETLERIAAVLGVHPRDLLK